MYCNTMFILNLIEKILQTSNAEPHQHEALHFLDGTSQEKSSRNYGYFSFTQINHYNNNTVVVLVLSSI